MSSCTDDSHHEAITLKRTCSFYVPKKKRLCKMLVSEGNKFCGQHLVGEVDQSGKKFKRIPCPLDPKHSCYEHKIENHLLHCNAKEDTSCPYKSVNCNLGPYVEEPLRLKISEISSSRLEDIINKIEENFAKFINDSIKEEICSHVALASAFNSPEFGTSVNRHLHQNASLVGHLEKVGGFSSDNKACFLEFGAGRGQLTRWIIEAMNNYDNKTFVLIDRSARRHKQDAKLRCDDRLDIQRLRIDIQHLDIKRVGSITSSKSVYGVGKHLCGGATDLTLRCLAENTSLSSSITIIIALCCHNQCSWQSYTGRDFLQKSGFSPEDFYIMLGISSWAVCGIKHSVTSENLNLKLNKEANLQDNDSNPADDKHSVNTSIENGGKVTELPIEDSNGKTNERPHNQIGLTPEKRKSIGRKAKQLIDYGRMQYLISKGFDAKLIKYTMEEMTLENIAIVASKKNKSC